MTRRGRSSGGEADRAGLAWVQVSVGRLRGSGLRSAPPCPSAFGESIRLFFGTGGPNVGSNFHIIGEIFDKVYSGSPDTFIANEETWYVPPGSVAVFEFSLDVPGNYLLVDHALYRVGKGAAGLLKVSGPHDDSIYSPPPN